MDASTKKKILVYVAWGVGAVLLLALLAYISFLGRFAVYQDKDYGFSMKYPRYWQKVEHPQPGGAVVFVSLPENAMDNFRENVNIAVQDVSPEIATLKSFTDRILLQMGKVFSNIKVEESKAVTFGGRSGYRVLFSADKPDPIKILNVWTIHKGERAYIFTYMAQAKNYKKYLYLVEEMIRSFKLQ